MPYAEGDWVAVPLGASAAPKGWAVGRLARVREPAALVYLFGPVLSAVPSLPSVEAFGLSASGAEAYVLVSTLGLRDGSWVVVGSGSSFVASEWPLGEFLDTAVNPGGPRAVSYSEDDLVTEVGLRAVSADEAASLPPAGHSGAVFVQRWFCRRLGVDPDS